MGLRLGVFEHLATRPAGATTDEVAWALDLDPLYTHALLRSAFAAEVLDREDGRYRLAPHMDTVLLDQDSPAYLGGAVGVAVALRETFLDLPRFARTGERKWWDAFDPEWGHDVAVINVSPHEARDIQAVVARARRPSSPAACSSSPNSPSRNGKRIAAPSPAGSCAASSFFEAHIGCQLLPTSHFVTLLEDAGFRDVGVVDVNPTHVVVHGRK